MTKTLTTRTYDLREIGSERLIDTNDAIKKLDAYEGLIDVCLTLDDALKCYIGNKILIQIHPCSVARVRGEGEIEQKLKEITTQTGVRFY